MMEHIWNDYKIYALKKIQFLYYRSFEQFGKNTYIESPLLIRGKQHISVGNNVGIRRGARLEVVTHYAGEIYKPHLIIEDSTTIENFFHVSCIKSIHIGKNVLIASFVSIVDNNHGYTNVNCPIKYNKLEGAREVTICDESFLGIGVKIMPGVTVGKHCVIGANSVVTHSIPDYSVAVGSPAHVVRRYNFSSKRWEKTDGNGEFI